jgi:type VI secretion system protein ImpC
MPDYPSRSSVHIDIRESAEAASAVLDPDAPFRILILGDFTGRVQRGEKLPIAGRRTIKVDCDNFEEVIEQLNVRLDVPRASLRFRELDHFHPDHIYRTAPVFQELENLRPATTPKAPPANLLESMIGESESHPVRAEDAGDLAAFIKRVSAKHMEDRPDAAQLEWKAKVKAASSELMKQILHHAPFQALEAAWRSVLMLITRLGAEEGIELAICDVTLDELTADPEATSRWLAGSKKPWSLVVANFAFGQGSADARRLAILGNAARAAEAPLMAEAQPPADEGSAEWQALRRSAEARWIGLSLPRFLVRLPYGKSTSPLEALDFEEMPVSEHGHYLWGNPAFCCACLIGLAFRAHGWDLRPGMVRRLDDMPLHVYDEDGESETKPCAEVWMNESTAEQLLEQGFIPLASLKGQDSVMVVRFCSIASPAAPLSGRWNG